MGGVAVERGAYDPDTMGNPVVRFSVCIPNFNNARSLGDTVASALGQAGPSLEVWVSDNASTDGSRAVVQSFVDPRVHIGANRTNVGFAGNLDRAVRPSSGEWVALMSPGDLMEPGALDVLDVIARSVGSRAVITARARQVDDGGRPIGSMGPDPLVWRGAPVNRPLSELTGRRILELDAAAALERTMSTMANPFNSVGTAYPRSLYDRIGGYLGARTMSPDKWFHWRLLSVAERAFFVDDELFSTRSHDRSHRAAPQPDGALELLVDDYVSSFELGPALLERSGLGRREVEQAFVEQDIARHGLASLARGERAHARRISSFGLAAYPSHARRNPRWWLLRALTSLGPLGETAARAAYLRSDAGSPRT